MFKQFQLLALLNFSQADKASLYLLLETIQEF